MSRKIHTSHHEVVQEDHELKDNGALSLSNSKNQQKIGRGRVGPLTFANDYVLSEGACQI